MIHESETSTTFRAKELGISRSTIYYKLKQPDKDWKLKCQIEEVLREHPLYGSPRIALALNRNHKPVERVMKIFGIKAYRRRGLKRKKTKNIKVFTPIYSSLPTRHIQTIFGLLILPMLYIKEKISTLLR